MSAQHTPGLDEFMSATHAQRNRMLRTERLSVGKEAATDIVLAMRNEMQAELEKAFGEFAFLWKYVQDLNLDDAEDRAIFRGRVSHALHMTKVDAMREWLPSAPRDRDGATRAVADEYIRRAAIAKAGASK